MGLNAVQSINGNSLKLAKLERDYVSNGTNVDDMERAQVVIAALQHL